jgi:hypothetical protein
MTAADLCGCAKPWNIHRQTVKKIFEEFYAQVGRLLEKTIDNFLVINELFKYHFFRVILRNRWGTHQFRSWIETRKMKSQNHK